MDIVTAFIFLGSKITADHDCSHEIKRRLLLGRRAMKNLDSVLKKQRHHFAKKGLFVKAIYCHSAYLTYTQSTSYKMPGWKKHKVE